VLIGVTMIIVGPSAFVDVITGWNGKAVAVAAPKRRRANRFATAATKPKQKTYLKSGQFVGIGSWCDGTHGCRSRPLR